jgi:hypothetical protein
VESNSACSRRLVHHPVDMRSHLAADDGADEAH